MGWLARPGRKRALVALENYEYRLLGYYLLHEKICISAVFLYASTISFVKLGEEPELVFVLYDDKFVRMTSEPVQLIRLV